MNDQRHSQAENASLITDEVQRAAREAENAIRQFDRVLDIIEAVHRDRRPFRLRNSIIQDLHRVALDGLSLYAGNWRPGSIIIGQSKHTPPPAHLVAGLMEEMCDWVNGQWSEKTPIQLSSYVMWRLNWIHPFDDGNGRTSRAVAYLVLCAAAGTRFPGRVTIPELIASNKQPYYDALEAADASEANGQLSLEAMESLLEACLAKQLTDAFEAASGRQAEDQDKNRRFH